MILSLKLVFYEVYRHNIFLKLLFRSYFLLQVSNIFISIQKPPCKFFSWVCGIHCAKVCQNPIQSIKKLSSSNRCQERTGEASIIQFYWALNARNQTWNMKAFWSLVLWMALYSSIKQFPLHSRFKWKTFNMKYCLYPVNPWKVHCLSSFSIIFIY